MLTQKIVIQKKIHFQQKMMTKLHFETSFRFVNEFKLFRINCFLMRLAFKSRSFKALQKLFSENTKAKLLFETLPLSLSL